MNSTSVSTSSFKLAFFHLSHLIMVPFPFIFIFFLICFFPFLKHFESKTACTNTVTIILHLRCFLHIISGLLACVASLLFSSSLSPSLPFSAFPSIVLLGARYLIPPASSKRFPGFFSWIWISFAWMDIRDRKRFA